MAQDISNGTQADAAFAARTLAALPAGAPSATLETRILADFDAVAAKRRRALWAVTLRLAHRLGDAVWPGVPAWQPAAVFALSLVLGLAAGTQLPVSAVASDSTSQTLTLDTAPVLDISEDI